MLWTVNRVIALVLGVIFTLIGLVGFFIPADSHTGMQNLMGIFHVDTVHNTIHLVTGLIAIVAAFAGQARTFNQVFGIIYTLIGLLGLIPSLYFPDGSYGHENGLFLGLIHLNAADHVLHLVIGIVALVAGFFLAGSASHPATPRPSDNVTA